MKVRGYQSAGMLQNNWYASVVEPFRGCNTSYKYEAIKVSSRLYLVFDYGSFVLGLYLRIPANTNEYELDMTLFH